MADKKIGYYTPGDLKEIPEQLDTIIAEIVKVTACTFEPTIEEKRKVLAVIRDFIRSKGRIVYGGTALNEAIRQINPKDTFYDDYNYTDIEFYSPDPTIDAVELCNLLYEKGFINPESREAIHEETFIVKVNLEQFCDITYVPARIYSSIQTIVIDGIKYVHPHFLLIDHLRIVNQPLTAADLLWKKTFARSYLLLKYFPFNLINSRIEFPPLSEEMAEYRTKVWSGFLTDKRARKLSLICGMDAYNFYINYGIKNINNARKKHNSAKPPEKISRYISNVPFIELVTVEFTTFVPMLFEFLVGVVRDPSLLKYIEYRPFFQFTGPSCVIVYRDHILVKVFSADGFCVPYYNTENHSYVSYQYTLMMLLIHKFKAFVDGGRLSHGEENPNRAESDFLRRSYGTAISNLVLCRNEYLSECRLGPINDTPIGDFKHKCLGNTVSYRRMGNIRSWENRKMGRYPFHYNAEEHLAKPVERQKTFNPARNFKNTSGREVNKPEQQLLKQDGLNLFVNVVEEPVSETETETEPSRVNNNSSPYHEEFEIPNSDEDSFHAHIN